MAVSNIDRAIELYLEKWRGKKVAIYPFGKMGMETKRILNWQYGIEETLIVDNHLSNMNPQISALKNVENPEEYIWLLTCSNPNYHKSIFLSLKELVPEEQIIDIFKDMLIYSGQYRFLSKLGTNQAEYISLPCWEFLEVVKKKKNENRVITVAEIGVGYGASTVEACKLLSDKDTYYCFDYEDSIKDLFHDLNKIPEICCEKIGVGNSRKLCDSYNWNLCELLFEMRNNNKNGIFDVVYLDGSHTFLHDGLACCLLKELLKPEGYIIFDDITMTWKSGGCQQLYIESKAYYPEEQLCDRQVQRVVNAFMIEDKRFQQVYMRQTINPIRAVFIKK